MSERVGEAPEVIVIRSRADALRVRTQRIERLRAELAERFAGVQELTVELGCGHGHYLAAYSEAFPDDVCVGVDLRTRRVRLAQRKRDKRALGGLHFLKGEAGEFLEALPDFLCLRRTFILFPDPWPRRRHHKNRLIQPDFLSLLARRSVSGATLHYRTDHEEYFEWTLEHLAAHTDWVIDTAAPWPFEAESIFQRMMGSYQSVTARRAVG